MRISDWSSDVCSSDLNLGKVARGARRGAREDDILHAAAAHRLGTRFAHHPADRFEQVRLAATIGADDAGQPGLDAQFSGFDETFETGEAQPFYLHGMPPGSSSNRSWCNLGVTDPPCSRHAAWVGESQAHKPLPLRGGVGVGAIRIGQSRMPPPAATKPASWQVSLPSPEGEG